MGDRAQLAASASESVEASAPVGVDASDRVVQGELIALLLVAIWAVAVLIRRGDS